MGSDQIKDGFTTFFIPFRTKDYSAKETLEERPDENIWKEIGRNEVYIDKVTKNLLPFAYELFYGEYPECRIYTIKNSNEFKTKEMLTNEKFRLELNETESQNFSINDIKLFLFPTNAIGVLIFEIEPHSKKINDLLKLNHAMRVLHHGKIPSFSKLSKSSEHPAFNKIKEIAKDKEEIKYLDNNLNFSQEKIWGEKNGSIKFKNKTRDAILRNLWQAQNKGVLLDGKICYPNLKLKKLCELLCGDIFFFEEYWIKKNSNSSSKDIKNTLKKHWKYMLPTGRLPGQVYVNSKYNDREPQKKKDLFHLRRFYDRKYYPSDDQLSFKNNDEIMTPFKDITIGVSREGVAFIDEKGLFTERVKRHYRTVILISLVIRWRLTHISTNLIDVTMSRESSIKNTPEKYRKKLSELRDKIMDFDVSTSLNEVSDISHINEMYEMFNKLLGTKKYFSEIRRSIAEVDEYLKREKDRKEEKLQKTIQIILFIFLPLSAATSLYSGNQLVKQTEGNWFPFTDIFSELPEPAWVTFFIYLLFFYVITILFYYWMKKKEEISSIFSRK